MTGLAVRTLLRFVVPIAIVTVILVGPTAWLAFRAPWPNNLESANAALRFGFVLAATGWTLALVGVAGVSPLVRSVAAGAPLSQGRAAVAALANLVRMAIPCLAAIAAIVMGGLALVIPAFVLMALLSLTGASTEHGMPAPLLDSVRVVRAQLVPVIVIVAALIVVESGLAVIAWKVLAVPFAKKLKPEQWASYGNIARVVVIGNACATPIAATLLAAIRERS